MSKISDMDNNDKIQDINIKINNLQNHIYSLENKIIKLIKELEKYKNKYKNKNKEYKILIRNLEAEKTKYINDVLDEKFEDLTNKFSNQINRLSENVASEIEISNLINEYSLQNNISYEELFNEFVKLLGEEISSGLFYKLKNEVNDTIQDM